MRFFQFLASAAIIMLSLGATNSRSEEQESHCGGMLVALTSAEEQTQLFALDVAAHTARQAKSVAVILCGAAGELALRQDHAADPTPENMSPNLRLRQLILQGVTVQVCPHYLSNSEAKPTELIEGVTEVVMPAVARRMMGQLRVLTF